LIEANQLLPGPLGEPGSCHGHGLKRAAETLAAFQSRFRHALHSPVIAREEAHNQV
jgi:hypothetical protein